MNSSIARAITGDDLLTALASIASDKRSTALTACGIRILRDAADLCGVDASTLTRRQAIAAIVENF